MPDLKQVLSEEIRRLARKEMKQAIDKLNETIISQKKLIADLQKRVKVLESNTSKKESSAKTERIVIAGDSATASSMPRITASKITSIRKKLGLTQAKFAAIIGVNQFSVCNWEAGKTEPRREAKELIAKLRTMGKREFKKMLADKVAAAPAE